MKVQLEAIASLLANIEKRMQEEREILLVMVLQGIEMNKLMKKLNYISGTDTSVSLKEVEEEFAFLRNHIDTFAEEVKEVVQKISALPDMTKEKKDAVQSS